MKIFVDADACPVKDEIMQISQKYKLKTFFVGTTKQLFLITGESTYYEWKLVDESKESTDIFIANSINEGDIVVTQDYRLATLSMAKCGAVITYRGRNINDENIDFLLFKKNIKPKTVKGKRNIDTKNMDIEDRVLFADKLSELINSL